jgi:hypothetical protein
MPYDGDTRQFEVNLRIEDDAILGLLERGRMRVRRGWCQEVLAKLRSGQRVLGFRVRPIPDEEVRDVCAIGAIFIEEPFSHNVRTAIRYLRESLPPGWRGSSVSFYNDNKCRTRAEILSLYDRAIELRKQTLKTIERQG